MKELNTTYRTYTYHSSKPYHVEKLFFDFIYYKIFTLD